MPLESATYVDDLVPTNPLGTDDASLGDDHIRLIKSALKNTFPNLDGALTTKLAALNGVSQLITVGSDGKTLTFTFPSGGTVGNVTDWTSNQPVPASQADGRYIQKGKSVNDYPPIAAGINRSSGEIWLNYEDDSGNTKYAFAQPAGDYVTNPQLQGNVTLSQQYHFRTDGYTEFYRQASNPNDGIIDFHSNYQSNNNNVLRITSDGSIYTLSGGNLSLDNPYATASNSGDYNASPEVEFQISGRGAYATLKYEEVVGRTNQLTLSMPSFNNNSGNTTYFWFDGPSGRINSTAGLFALTSELPTAGTIPSGTYTKTPMNDGTGRSVLVQSFTVQAAHMTTITLPIAMANASYQVSLATAKDTADGSSSHAVGFLNNSKTTTSFIFVKSWIANGGAGNEPELQATDVVVRGIVA